MDHLQDSQGSAPQHAPTGPAEDPGLVVCSQASHHQQVHQGQLLTGVPTGPALSPPSVPTCNSHLRSPMGSINFLVLSALIHVQLFKPQV